MPGIVRRTLGTADKVRESTLHPPDKGWECFLENAPGDVVLGAENEAVVPRPRRRRRKTTTTITSSPVAATMPWEQEEEGFAVGLLHIHSSPPPTAHRPNDRLRGNDDGRNSTRAGGQEGVGAVTRVATTSELSSAVSSASGILGSLTTLAAGISQIQDTLKELMATNSVRSNTSSPPRKEDLLLSRMEALVTRFEASGQRQESVPQQQQLQILDLQAQILTLQKEAQERNAIIVELQQSQEEERKESQERIAEVLQRLAEVQAEKDALRTAATTTTTTRTQGSSPFDRGTSADRHQRSIARNSRSTSRRRTNGVDDSSMDSFGTPIGGPHYNDEDKSDDSPFSTGEYSVTSSSSNKAVSKRKRKITPGATLARATKKLKDLVPHYPRSYGPRTK